MPVASFVATTLQVASSTGVDVPVKAAALPDGSLAFAHAFVDASGASLDPAKDATVTAATAAIQAATLALLVSST